MPLVGMVRLYDSSTPNWRAERLSSELLTATVRPESCGVLEMLAVSFSAQISPV